MSFYAKVLFQSGFKARLYTKTKKKTGQCVLIASVSLFYLKYIYIYIKQTTNNFIFTLIYLFINLFFPHFWLGCVHCAYFLISAGWSSGHQRLVGRWSPSQQSILGRSCCRRWAGLLTELKSSGVKTEVHPWSFRQYSNFQMVYLR